MSQCSEKEQSLNTVKLLSDKSFPPKKAMARKVGKSPKEKAEIERLRKVKAEQCAQNRLISKRKKLIKDLESAYTKSIANLKHSEAQVIKTMKPSQIQFHMTLFDVDAGPTNSKLILDMQETYAKSIEKLKRNNAELIGDFEKSIEKLNEFHDAQ